MESLLPPARSQGSVVFFYCSFNDTHSQSPQNILGSILSQLYQESEESDLSELEKAYEDQSRNTNRPSQIPEQRLFDLILKKTQTKMETFIFIDGLNECAEPSVVLSWLKTLVNTTRRVHIFLSSINEKGIEDELRDVKSLTIDTLETTRIGGDIILLIYASLEAHPRLKMHSAALREEIAEALMTGAQGM